MLGLGFESGLVLGLRPEPGLRLLLLRELAMPIGSAFCRSFLKIIFVEKKI